MAGRIPRLSAILKRGLIRMGVRPRSKRFTLVFVTIGVLARAVELPGRDGRTAFPPGHAHVRRVPGENLWILYRFDEQHVFVMTVRDQPPVPIA